MRVFVRQSLLPTIDATSLARGIYICQYNETMAIKPMRTHRIRAWKVCSLVIVLCVLCGTSVMDEAEIEPFLILDAHGKKLFLATLPPS